MPNMSFNSDASRPQVASQLYVRRLMRTDIEVYVALLEEAVDVWRPVMAKPIGGEIFLLLGEVPPEETWQFTPGTHVRCKEHIFEGGERGLVAVEAIYA